MESDEEDWEDYVDRKMDEDFYGDGPDLDFADPGGNSALRAATPTNPRDQPCPDCERPNTLTRKDVALGYCCDRCADRKERGCDY